MPFENLMALPFDYLTALPFKYRQVDAIFSYSILVQTGPRGRIQMAQKIEIGTAGNITEGPNK